MIKKTSLIAGILTVFTAVSAFAGSSNDILIKFSQNAKSKNTILSSLTGRSGSAQPLLGSWYHVKNVQLSEEQLTALKNNPAVEAVQPNFTLYAFGVKPSSNQVMASTDKPAIPNSSGAQTPGADPLLDSQWGLKDINVQKAWTVTKGSPKMIVAVIDTGVDYTHEDLVNNLWRNPGETGVDAKGNNKANNQIDDDANGFIDDVIGWDFTDSNDNKPYDITTPPEALLSGEGNPGHGTHCAGTIAAQAGNGVGISGISPNSKIMALRFITEKGQGTTDGAIRAIKYAVDNGAKVLSNSWGSEGDDPADAASNQALHDAINYAMNKGVLFVAAAGNGHSGVGYDNDTDPKPGVPASYPIDNIVSVSAIDINGQLGSFSNWGAKTVHIAAPGVDVFSTMVGNRYSDKVLDFAGFTANWDGTSMAAPHVAGAAALYWSAHPEKSYKDVKNALLSSAKKTDALKGKSVSEGKLDVGAMF